jgi:dihydrofolate synthase/folylpolyglutamate synthase
VNASSDSAKTPLVELIGRLSALHQKRIDLGLERMHRLLERLGHPERKLAPVIHIAGTNGKGRKRRNKKNDRKHIVNKTTIK